MSELNYTGWFDLVDMFDPTKTAIVGNAGSLMGSGLGPSIDSNTLVVRFNQARTIGFEQDLGSRTDLLICNIHQFESPVETRVPCRAVLALVDTRSARFCMNNFKQWIGSTPVWFSCTPDILPTLPTRRTLGYTSGIYGTYLLLQYFSIEELLVLGFNFYDGCAGATGHYWESDVIPAPFEHDLHLDREMMKALLNKFQGNLDVFFDVGITSGEGRILTPCEFGSNRKSNIKSMGTILSNKLLSAGMTIRSWAEM